MLHLYNNKHNKVLLCLAETLLYIYICINPLNAELNAICHMVALLGAHHILHVSGLTLQRGVTSTARHSVNITCRGVTSPARHAARSH